MPRGEDYWCVDIEFPFVESFRECSTRFVLDGYRTAEQIKYSELELNTEY